MHRLVEVNSSEDVFPPYRSTPLQLLLEYHNLGRPFDTHTQAQLLVGMCMDNRKHLTIPDNFAFIIRSGGANLRYSEFKVSYAIALGNIRHIALIAHNNCGMANLVERKELFVSGLVEKAGWERQAAEEHFNKFAPMFEVGYEVDFVIAEARRLRMSYPRITVAPMFYRVENNRLYMVKEVARDAV